MDASLHILLIEDNAGDARLIREMLRDADDGALSLDVASTLRDGLNRLRQADYDLILLDLSLPDSFGVETLRTAHQAGAHVPIVVLTGFDDKQIGIQAVQAGAQDYLVKNSITGDLLVRAIHYAVERYRVEQAIRRSEEEYRSLIDDVFETSVVAVIILDRHLNVVWCNEATERYFGLERSKILGQNKLELIDRVLKCIFADPDDYVRRLTDAYTQHSFTDRFECRVLPGENREERWLEHWSQPITAGLYAGGRIEQYTDITQRKRLEFAEQEQRRFSDALRDITAVLTSTLDLEEVLDRILENIGRVVPHDTARITLIDSSGEQIARQRSSAPAESEVARRADTRAYAGVPIRLQDQTIGYLHIYSDQPNAFSEQDVARLNAFAEQAAIAIQNARLFHQSQELAAIEERQRLARDLHDSVSQTIFTCSAMTESALRRWERDPQRAFELMTEAHRLTLTALSEMRILLLELRPESMANISLKQLFQQYLEPMQSRREFKLDMYIDDVEALPGDVQIAFYRIAQEALNNIEKHARATRVSIAVKEYEDRIELRIHDDGVGFRVEDIAATSLGLGIMRERAIKIGATLSIESKPSFGTQITVIWNKRHTASPEG